MQKRSIITWKDAAKLAFGIAVGISCGIGIIRCTGRESEKIVEDKVNDILSKTGVEVNKDSITDISTSVIGNS